LVDDRCSTPSACVVVAVFRVTVTGLLPIALANGLVALEGFVADEPLTTGA